VLKAVPLGHLLPWLLVCIRMMVFMPYYRTSHSGMALLGTWASLWSLALTLMGAITAVCAVLERVQARLVWLNTWDPRKLPRIARRKARVSRVESVFGLAFRIPFLAAWLSFSRSRHVL